MIFFKLFKYIPVNFYYYYSLDEIANDVILWIKCLKLARIFFCSKKLQRKFYCFFHYAYQWKEDVYVSVRVFLCTGFRESISRKGLQNWFRIDKDRSTCTSGSDLYYISLWFYIERKVSCISSVLQFHRFIAAIHKSYQNSIC